MIVRRHWLVALFAVLAVIATLVYGAYLAPQWDPSRDDQVQFRALARGLVERLQYTRAAPGEPFIPEPLRFPGYPLFLAPLCIGGCSPWLVTGVQALLVGLLVVIVFNYCAPMLGTRGASVAAGIVALYPAFAFFAAHTLSDLLATVLFAATIALAASRPPNARTSLAAIALGVLAALTVLTRPFLVFVLPLALAVAAARYGMRRAPRVFAITLVVFAVVVAPYVAYVEASFGRPVAGSTGAQLWLGYFQRRSPSTLDAFERAQADAGRDALAQFDAITDPVTQAEAFPPLDDELRSRALALIGHDPLGFMARGIDRSIMLWAGDVPLRSEDVSDIMSGIWIVVNVTMLVLGIAGAIHLARRDGVASAMPLLVVAVTWILSYPLWAEGRFSLPARPFLAIGVAAFFVRPAGTRTPSP